MKKLTDRPKEILDKEFVRMILDHNLPSRISRYEGFRSWLNNTLIFCGAEQLYIPCSHESFIKISNEEKEEILARVRDSLEGMTEQYCNLPFVFVYHDE